MTLASVAISSVDEAFEAVLQRIELNATRVALASQRYNAVKASIERALPGKTVRQIGSFQRKTKIRPQDLSDKLDIDAIVSFGPFRQYAPDGVTPSRALETVQNGLAANETYEVMPQVRDHPIMRLEYADHMSIELVPAYEDQTGQHPHGNGGPACYIVGSSSSHWRPADYDYDALMISTLNSATNGKLVPTVKLVKTVFRNQGVPLKSFHTEVLVANVVPAIISAWDSQKYRYGYEYILAEFLTRAASVVTSPVALGGSFSPPSASDLNGAMLGKIGQCFAERGLAAWQLCKKAGRDAVIGWHDFFGDPFPA